jgi:hypothetical protein
VVFPSLVIAFLSPPRVPFSSPRHLTSQTSLTIFRDSELSSEGATASLAVARGHGNPQSQVSLIPPTFFVVLTLLNTEPVAGQMVQQIQLTKTTSKNGVARLQRHRRLSNLSMANSPISSCPPRLSYMMRRRKSSSKLSQHWLVKGVLPVLRKQ